jgi:hypothetical protein
MIADMMRVMAGIAAWAAGTVIAVGVTWFGANVVIRNAGVGPGMPVVNAAVLPPSAASSLPSQSLAPTPPVTVTPTGTPASARAGQTSAGPTSASPADTGASPPATAPASSSAGPVRAYALAGGTVTLDVTQGSAQLVTAVPDAGYSVQTWSGTGWLRVDFSSGPQVSSLIASWYQHAPSITVTN